MIPTDELQLTSFREERSDGALTKSRVKVGHSESDRFWTATVERVDGDIVLEKFYDSATTAFAGEAFTALWYCLEEFSVRDIHVDTDPIAFRDAGHVSDKTTTTETPDADTEAPQPTTALSDGGAVSAVSDSPGVLGPVQPDHDTDGEWCLRCGDGPFSQFAIHHGRVHGDMEPVTLSDHPDTIVAESEIPRSRVDAVIAAVESADGLRDVMHALAATDADQVRDLLDRFDLLRADKGRLRTGEGLQMRLDALREVASDDE